MIMYTLRNATLFVITQTFAACQSIGCTKAVWPALKFQWNAYLPLFVLCVASSLGDVSTDERISCIRYPSLRPLPLPAMLNFEDVEDRDGALTRICTELFRN